MSVQFRDPIGTLLNGLAVPLAGGKLYFFTSLTSTPLATFSDDGLTIPNTNPIVLDSEGRTSVQIFLQDADYKVILKNAAGLQVGRTIDPLHGADEGNALRTDLANTSSLAKGDALVGVKRDATASVALTVHSWIEGQVFNVVEFGAKGDGSTDDTAAIQAAINAAQAVVGSVFLPASVISTNGYKITTPLVISKPIKLTGESWGTTFIYASGFTAGQYALDLDGTISPNLDGVEISNLTFFSSNSTPHLIKSNNVSNSVFRNIGIRDAVNGMLITGTRNFCNIYDHIINTGGVTGISVSFSAYTGGGNHTFIGCSFGGDTGVHISTDSVLDQLSFVSCNFESCVTNSFYCGGIARALSFFGCRFEGCTGTDDCQINPVALKSVVGLVFKGCWFDCSGLGPAFAIKLGGAGGSVRGFEISGNYAQDYSTAFVDLSGEGNSGSIMGNRLQNTPAITNAVRPGVLIINNENQIGALGPQWNPPLTVASLPTNAVDLATTEALVNAIKTALIAVGICA